MEHISQYYNLKNGYSNVKDRDSFSIEIIKCSANPAFEREECHDDNDIRDFASHIIMT